MDKLDEILELNLKINWLIQDFYNELSKEQQNKINNHYQEISQGVSKISYHTKQLIMKYYVG